MLVPWRVVVDGINLNVFLSLLHVWFEWYLDYLGEHLSSSEPVDKTHPSPFKGCTSDTLWKLISSYGISHQFNKILYRRPAYIHLLPFYPPYSPHELWGLVFWVKTCVSGLLCWTSLCQQKSSLLRCPTLLFKRKRWCAMPMFAWVIHGKWGEVCPVNICNFFACLSEYILDIPNFWVLTLTWGSATVWML